MKSFKLLFLALPLLLAGCGEPQQAANPAAAPPVEPVAHKPRIALVMKTLTNPFFIEMEKGARKAETELNIELIVKTAAQETSFEQQVAIVDDLIQNHLVDAIVVAPADTYHLVPSLKKAHDAGIAVVNIDARLDPKAMAEAGLANVPFISVDNEMGGYLSAQALVKGVTSPTQVAILEGIRTADNAEARKRGAMRAFAENPKIKLVASETAHWKIDEGYTATKAILARYPGLGALFAANDMMALGAIKYLSDAGKTQVKVAGFDALPEVQSALDSGAMVATIDQQAAEQGYQGVLYAMRLLKKEQLPVETLLNVRLVKAGPAAP